MNTKLTGTVDTYGSMYISETAMINFDDVDETLEEAGKNTDANRAEMVSAIERMMKKRIDVHTTSFGYTLTQEFDENTRMAHILDEYRIVIASCHYN